MKEKGIQIQGNSVKIHIGKKSAVAKGSLYLNEDIAKKADTEILEIERNKKDESFRLMIDIPAEHERNVFGQFDAYAKSWSGRFM